MSKAASNFRMTDVKRAIKAAESAGFNVGRIELQGGKIILFPDKNGNVEEKSSEEIKL